MPEANWMMERKCEASLSRRVLVQAQRLSLQKKVLHPVTLPVELLLRRRFFLRLDLFGKQRGYAYAQNQPHARPHSLVQRGRTNSSSVKCSKEGDRPTRQRGAPQAGPKAQACGYARRPISRRQSSRCRKACDHAGNKRQYQQNQKLQPGRIETQGWVFEESVEHKARQSRAATRD